MTEPEGDLSTSEPLCVDLDGTLVHTDLLFENLLSMLTGRPWLALQALLWLLRGRAQFKAEIARRVTFDPGLLPYDERVLDYLRTQKKNGRTLVLATASARPWADAIAGYLGLFDAVIATESGLNLKGAIKATALRKRFGRFSYLGNDRRDFAVWKQAEKVGIANASRTLARRIASSHPVEIDIPRRTGRIHAILKAIRPYQWSKNLLVFVPILTANHLENLTAWMAALIAFVTFGSAASGIYILNDLTDLTADRAHARKRLRPFANGMVPIPIGIFLSPLLLACGLGLAWHGGLFQALIPYVVVSLAYTFRVKELPLVDVFTLAFLYVIRLFAGGLSTGYPLSLWLLGFSAFLFLGLAFIKRVAELLSDQEASASLNRRGYLTADILMLKIMGVGSSFASIVLLALYVQSPEVGERYASPTVLWALVPIILFWQMRLWLSTSRGYMHDDPIVYSARDWVSWLVSAAAVAIMVVANQTTIAL